MDVQPESKIEEKKDQVKLPEVATQNNANDESPPIKSEENKPNWANFRAQREAERKAKEEAEKRAEQKAAEAEALKKALEALTYKSPPSNDDYEESEEEKIEKKVQIALEKKINEFEKKREDKELQETPQRIARDYPDWSHVCNDENFDYIDYHYPEITAAFRHMPDGYDKRASVYKAIKKLVPNIDSRKDQAKMEKNLNKPASIASSTNAPSANAMGAARLSEDRKAENWQRMQKALKGIS